MGWDGVGGGPPYVIGIRFAISVSVLDILFKTVHPIKDLH